MMKKLIIILMALLVMMALTAFAEDVRTDLKVVFDGQEIVFSDEQPFTNIETPMPDGSTFKAEENHIQFIPVRAMAEFLGYDVSWEGETRTVTVQKEDRVTTFTLGGRCYVNGVEKACVVNFPNKNGRVFISQYGACHAFDCVMRWDDTNRVLYFFSNEKYPDGIDWTQNKYLKTDGRYDELAEFNSMSEPAFVIPGLQESLVAQGIAYRKDKNQFYVSGYSDFSPSGIAVIDAETGEMVAQYRVLNEDGSKNYAHLGGIAIDEKNLYISGGMVMQRIPLSSFDSAGESGYIKIEETIKLNIGNEVNNSFVEISDGYLWTGNYYEPAKKKYAKKAHENYPVIIRGYKLDSSQPNGLAAEYKVENEKYDYVPEIIYALESDECIQGLTTSGEYLFAAASIRKSPSDLRIYDIKKAMDTEETINLGENINIPVIRLNLEKTVQAASYIEEIAVVDGYIYTLYEGATPKFRDANNKYVADSVWKTDISKLVTPNAE